MRQHMMEFKTPPPKAPPLQSLFALISAVILATIAIAPTGFAEERPSHAMAMHGAPALSDPDASYPYTDAFAMRGGTLKIGEMGTFDSLNPFIVGGTKPLINLDRTYFVVQLHTIESLMARSADEPFTLYGLLAEHVRLPDDRSWIEFTLREGTRFSDGSPLTVDDVVFSIETLKAEGRPNLRRYYAAVETIERPAPRTVRLIFNDTANQETPMILGLMPVLSKNYYSTREFDKTTLEPPLGSGPYILTRVDAGKQLTFERDPNYWGNDLPLNENRHNFDKIVYSYFRDETALFESFKTGDIMVRIERDAKQWATGYEFPAVKRRLVVRDEIKHGRPSDMYGFAFNTRRDMFADPRVREALIHLFDFEWMNENFFFDAFTRVQSYFDNSELSSRGRPLSPVEAGILGDYIEEIRPDIRQGGWSAPRSGGIEAFRANKRKALQLLREAGWTFDDGALRHQKSNTPFEFEVMISERSEERIALTFARALKEVGITMSVRMVDAAQFHERRATYEFDMVPFKWRGTLSPGNEQAFRFGSKEADIEGTFNVAGVTSPAVDHVIGRLTDATSRTELVAAARALDRLLLSGFYVVPFYYQPADRFAYWIELQRPETVPIMGTQLDTWFMTGTN